MLKKILLVIGLILFVGVGWYVFKSVREYSSSEYEAEGFFICNPENTVCERSEHVHAWVTVKECGTTIDFPKEKGRTDKQHTHKELNYIHWHAREKVDPKSHIPIDIYPRTLKAFLEQMDYKAPEKCGDQPATLTLKVNGTEEPKLLDYLWKDHDKLEVEIK